MVGLDDLKGLYQPKRFYDSKRASCESHLLWAAADQACSEGHLHLRFQITAPPAQPQIGSVLPVTPGQKTHPKELSALH